MSGNEDLQTRIQSAIQEVTRVDPQSLSLDTRFREDLDADSLTIVEIVMTLEEKLGIEIPDSAADKMHTIGDLLSYVSSQLSNTAAA